MAITYKPLLKNTRGAINVFIDDFKFIGRIMREPDGEGWRFHPQDKRQQPSEVFPTVEDCKHSLEGPTPEVAPNAAPEPAPEPAPAPAPQKELGLLRSALTRLVAELRESGGADYTAQALRWEHDVLLANMTREEKAERDRRETERRRTTIDVVMGVRRQTALREK